MASSVPHLIYAPIAGRAELTRLIAAAGGLKITESADMADFGSPVIQATGESKVEYLSPKGMPLLCHGDLKMSQSTSIEAYIASIAPKYKDLSPQQKAVDMMYMCIKEEMLQGAAKAIFTTQNSDKEQAKKDINAMFDKWCAIFEEKLPASGFVQGLSFPTAADLALLNLSVGYMPYGAAAKLAGGYDFGKWKKMKALTDRTAADPAVAEYLKNSEFYKGNPFGM